MKYNLFWKWFLCSNVYRLETFQFCSRFQLTGFICIFTLSLKPFHPVFKGVAFYVEAVLIYCKQSCYEILFLKKNSSHFLFLNFFREIRVTDCTTLYNFQYLIVCESVNTSFINIVIFSNLSYLTPMHYRWTKNSNKIQVDTYSHKISHN